MNSNTNLVKKPRKKQKKIIDVKIIIKKPKNSINKYTLNINQIKSMLHEYSKRLDKKIQKPIMSNKKNILLKKNKVIKEHSNSINNFKKPKLNDKAIIHTKRKLKKSIKPNKIIKKSDIVNNNYKSKKIPKLKSKKDTHHI